MILVDWSQGARFPYRRAAGNTRLVGAQIAELIKFLISSSSGTPDFAKRFYIVGFSFGAQTAGYAGTYLKDRGMTLGRITGRVREKYFNFCSLSCRKIKNENHLRKYRVGYIVSVTTRKLNCIAR